MLFFTIGTLDQPMSLRRRISISRCTPSLLFSFFFALSTPVAVALDQSLAITQYIHTKWEQSEGVALPSVSSLAQTRDGYLWLGSDKGLFRFDGVQFVKSSIVPSRDPGSRTIRALHVSTDGALWIGASTGIIRATGGGASLKSESRNLPGSATAAFANAKNGGVWVARAGVGGGLTLMKDGAVGPFAWQNHFRENAILALFNDRAGNLWAGTASGICRWNPAGVQCFPELAQQVFCITDDESGNLLVGDAASRSIQRLTPRGSKPLITQLDVPALVPKVMMRDRDGNVWIGTLGQGLLRLRGSRVDRFTRRNGLSSDLVEALFEDREGNVWVGTTHGVDSFRNPKVVRLSTVEGLSGDLITAVLADRNDDIWVGSAGGGLNRVRSGSIATYMGHGLPSSTVLSLFEDTRNTLWVGTSGGLAYLDGKTFVPVKRSGRSALDHPFTIEEDTGGTVWVLDTGGQLLRVQGQTAEPWQPPGVERHKRIYRFKASRSGTLWVGYYQGGVTASRDTHSRTYSLKDGLAAGPVLSIYEGKQGDLWVGTASGLSRFRNHKWVSWTSANALPEGGVHAIVEDDTRNLWLATTSGLLQLPLDQFDKYDNPPSRQLIFESYGLSDGLRFPQGGNMASPRFAKSRDGRLWIATEEGLATLNPRKVPLNKRVPNIVFEEFIADGKPLPVNDPGPLSLRGRELRISYTSPILTSPENVRFRYKLEGFDPGWSEADTRRQAIYTNLPPQSYKFRVMAGNNDGVWNESGASIDFLIEPYFYQTWWFATICLVSLLLFAFFLHRIRVQRLRARFDLVLAERTRVTRELHDTLLQGFVGVVLQLEAVSRRFHTTPEASRQRLERAIEQADKSLRDARCAIAHMRAGYQMDAPLPEALSATGHQLTSDAGMQFNLSTQGEVCHFSDDITANLYAIAGEAITNAVKHSRTPSVSVELLYSPRKVTITVVDQGIGFDTARPKSNRNSWGMVGMKERAAQIGASIMINSEPGKGARVTLMYKEGHWTYFVRSTYEKFTGGSDAHTAFAICSPVNCYP